jgi:hypothetical protein
MAAMTTATGVQMSASFVKEEMPTSTGFQKSATFVKEEMHKVIAPPRDEGGLFIRILSDFVDSRNPFFQVA